MSLLSLLIALMAEKSLSSSVWCFDYYYQKYAVFFNDNTFLSKLENKNLSHALFLIIPVAIVYGVLAIVENGLLNLIISTLILIVSLGCFSTRNSYKQYLQAAFKGEETTLTLCHKQLLQDKNIPDMGFGQALIWLNYRYYIAIMLFFIFFGAAGALFYRLLTTAIEKQNSVTLTTELMDKENDTQEVIQEEVIDSNVNDSPSREATDEVTANEKSIICKDYQNILFYIDWIPVRITSFGYMLVGHFSKAFPTWVENLFDTQKPANEILIDVAQRSEDIMVGDNDCTAEPCLLVRLAKRNVLLMLAFIAILTLIGIVN
jgi:AmpE protein